MIDRPFRGLPTNSNHESLKKDNYIRVSANQLVPMDHQQEPIKKDHQPISNTLATVDGRLTMLNQQRQRRLPGA